MTNGFTHPTASADLVIAGERALSSVIRPLDLDGSRWSPVPIRTLAAHVPQHVLLHEATLPPRGILGLAGVDTGRDNHPTKPITLAQTIAHPSPKHQRPRQLYCTSWESSSPLRISAPARAFTSCAHSVGDARQLSRRAWSSYGAKGSQTAVTSGKCSSPDNGRNTPKPLPPVATSRRRKRMVRRGSTVRVRERASQAPC